MTGSGHDVYEVIWRRSDRGERPRKEEEPLVKDDLEGIWCSENSFGVDGKEVEREKSRMERNRKIGGHIPTTLSIALSPTQGTEENTLVLAITVSKAFAPCLTEDIVLAHLSSDRTVFVFDTSLTSNATPFEST